jgi:serine/threonine protein kinase
LSERDAAFVVKQALEAVQYLRRRGVVHRDVKVGIIAYGRSDWDNVKLIVMDLCSLQTESAAPMPRICGAKAGVAPRALTECYTDTAYLWRIGVVAHGLFTGEEPCLPDARQKVFFSSRLGLGSQRAPCRVAGLARVARCLGAGARLVRPSPGLRCVTQKVTTPGSGPRRALRRSDAPRARRSGSLLRRPVCRFGSAARRPGSGGLLRGVAAPLPRPGRRSPSPMSAAAAPPPPPRPAQACCAPPRRTVRRAALDAPTVALRQHRRSCLSLDF